MNPALISMCGNTIIRYTDCYPYSTFHTGTLTDHLQNPDFIGISDTE